MKPDAYMPYYGDRFEQATKGLSKELKWSYWSACWHYWTHTHCEGLPADDDYLRRVCECEITEWARTRGIIFHAPFFVLEDGKWHQRFTREIYRRSQAEYDAQVERARLARLAQELKKGANVTPDIKPNVSPNLSPNISPEVSPEINPLTITITRSPYGEGKAPPPNAGKSRPKGLRFVPVKLGLYPREYEKLLADAKAELRRLQDKEDNYERTLTKEAADLVALLEREGKADRVNGVKARRDSWIRKGMLPGPAEQCAAWRDRITEIKAAMNGVVAAEPAKV